MKVTISIMHFKMFYQKDHIISCFWFSNLRHILQLQFCHALLISKVSDILKTDFGRGPKRHCNPLSFDCFLIICSPISCYCVLDKQTSVDRYDNLFWGQILINDGMCIWIGLWFSSFLSKINNKYYETYLMKLLLNQRHRGKKGNGKKNIYFICKFHSIELC